MVTIIKRKKMCICTCIYNTSKILRIGSELHWLRLLKDDKAAIVKMKNEKKDTTYYMCSPVLYKII